MSKPDSAYWKKRFELLEKAQHNIAVDAYKEIEEQYKRAYKELEYQIMVWWQRFADNNGVSMAEAKKILYGAGLEELKWDVEHYIKYGKENALTGQWIKQLENASARVHISKYEALKLYLQQSLEKLFNEQLKTVNSTNEKLFEEGYYRSVYEIQKGFGIGWNMTGIDQKKLDKVLSKPWAVDGKSFSDRIWDNKERLIQELHREITQDILLGRDPQKAIDAIAKKLNTSKSNAGRLVMTEEAYFSSVAQKEAYKELEVEKYEILATLDSHTSEICQGLDGKVFEMKDYQAGVTAPPFHVWCRTTTVPYFDDNFGLVGERAARDEDGKTYYVPADMKYKEWKEKFVGNDQFTNSNNNDIIKSGGTVASGQSRANRIKTKNIIQRGIAEERPIFADDTFGKNIAKVKSESGFYDVALHGSPVITEFFGTKIDSHTLAEIIRNRKDYRGESIRLLACRTGDTSTNVNCFAQRLANELKVNVKAPNNTIWAFPNGRITIGTDSNDNDGAFVLFKPIKKGE